MAATRDREPLLGPAPRCLSCGAVLPPGSRMYCHRCLVESDSQAATSPPELGYYWLDDLRTQQRGRFRKLIEGIPLYGPTVVLLALPALGLWYVIQAVRKAVLRPKPRVQDDDD